MDKRINIWINGKEVENNIKSIRSAMIHLTNQLNKMEIGSEEYIQTSKKLRDLKAIYDEHCKSLKMTNQEIENNTASWKKNIIHWGAFAAAAQGASAAVQRFIASTQEYVDAYATIDDAMSAVQKTTGMTREEVENLRNSLKNIDTRTSTEELLKIAEIGGRLGLAKEDIEAFARSVDVANVALGDSFQGGAEEIATVLGKIRGAFQDTKEMGIEDAFNAIGSALNSVGATCAATEGNVAQFAQRLGALPDAMKPSVQEAIGLGAAFENASINAEVAATAYGQLMTKAASNIGKFAAAMGEPVEEMRELLNTNPVEFMLRFAESMRGMPADELGAQLKDLKLNAVGVQEAIGAMSSQTEEFRRILEVSATEFANGTSMMEEFGTVNNNAAAQLEKAKNEVQDAKETLGKELIPVITNLTQQSANGIRVMTEVVKWIKDHKAVVIGLATAYNWLAIKQMAVVAAKKISTAWTKAEMAGESAGTVVTSLFALAKAKLAKNTLAAANAQKALKVAFAATPWGAIITAVLTLAGAFSFFSSKTDEAKEAQKDLTVEIEQQYNTEKKKVDELRKIIESENTSREQKLTAINKLKEIIPGYVAELDKEGKVIDNNRKAIDDYLKSLKNKIRYEGLANALTQSQNKQIELESNVDFLIDKAKNGSWFNAILMEIDDDIGKAREAVDQNKHYIASLMNEMEEMDLELIGKTGKNYAETYQTFNDSILQDFETNPGTDSSSDKNLKKQQKAYQKELTKFMEKQRIGQLSEWQKTKEQIENQYQQMVNKAKDLYGENSATYNDILRQLNESQAQTLAAALDKYLKTLSDASDKMMTEAKKMLNESDPDNKETPLIKAVFGEQQKWDKMKADLQQNIKSIDDILDTMKPEDDGWDELMGSRQKLYEQQLELQEDNATAISNVIRKHTKADTDFIEDKEKKLARSRMTEHERRVAEIKEEYTAKIDLKKRELEKLKELLKNNPENSDIAKQIEEMGKVIEELEALQGKEIAAVSKSSGQKTIWQQLAEFDWSKLSDNWQDALNLMSQGLQEFANIAFDIYGSIAQIQNNLMEAELQKTQETYDAKSAALQRQLNDGVISQKAYDAKMQKLNEEKEKKERKLKHEQFAREKTASIIQGAINAALAITNIWAQWAGQPIVAAILTAISAATTAAEIAAIATQPNPYAKGGYIRGRQYAVMGEQGDEWVASNKLLRDKEASAVIAALDDYQRGNALALRGISFAAPDPKIMSQAVSGNGRTFAPSNQTTNNYYQNPDDSELLKEIRKMNDFLRDPNNRRAYISRKIQLEFDDQEEEIRSMARL